MPHKALGLLLLLAAQTLSLRASVTNEVESLRVRVEQLEHQNRALSNHIAKIEGVNADYRFQILDTENRSAGYYTETHCGPLIIQCEKVFLQGDCFGLDLTIGNPQAATFEGVNLAFAWGRPDPDRPNKIVQLTNSITAGHWTHAEVVIGPMAKEDLKSLKVAAEVYSVTLRESEIK